MNFLVDAHLPRRVATWLIAAGCDAIHTLDLPDKNRTTDQQLLDVAEREQRVVVTKDADFVDSHILNARPAKLLLISRWDSLAQRRSYGNACRSSLIADASSLAARIR